MSVEQAQRLPRFEIPELNFAPVGRYGPAAFVEKSGTSAESEEAGSRFQVPDQRHSVIGGNQPAGARTPWALNSVLSIHAQFPKLDDTLTCQRNGQALGRTSHRETGAEA